MASLGQRFDANSYDTTQREFSELPNGFYEMEVEAADVVPTKDGTGQLLKTTMTVLRPEEFANRKIFNNYNLQNRNPTAEKIGREQLTCLCRSMGIEAEDTEELLFKTFIARVELGKPSKDGQFPARAEIKRYYFPDEGNVPAPAIDATQPAVRPAAANDNRPAAANDNRTAPARAAGGARPWSK